MQVKIIIGTISFMLAMIILGFAALLEPARLQEASRAFQGRGIENGAQTFASACATCHGVNGDALECFDSSGNTIGCVGRPLNHAPLLCGEPSQRMTEMSWTGSKRAFIFTTISAGRPGTLMPTWSETFGGPLFENQVSDVTDFVLNWQSEELCGAEGEGEAPQAEWPEDVAELPEGDATAGGERFVSAGCTACHGDPATPGSNAVGPHLGNIGNAGADRVEGMAADQYIYTSILHPNDFIAPICANDQACNQPSAMPSNFGQTLTPEDMANLIAYLMEQTSGEGE
jgi:mono/diheme cytochrome c family protein